MNIFEILEDLNEELLDEKAANLYDRHWDKTRNLWVYTHREKIGLSDKNRDVVVHHKDGNHENNHKRNLVPLSRADHCRQERPALKHEKCKICGSKHFGRGYCAKHYYLYVTKKKYLTKNKK